MLWLCVGEGYEAIAARLGHASIVTTLDRYADLQQTASQRTAAKVTEYAEGS